MPLCYIISDERYPDFELIDSTEPGADLYMRHGEPLTIVTPALFARARAAAAEYNEVQRILAGLSATTKED